MKERGEEDRMIKQKGKRKKKSWEYLKTKGMLGLNPVQSYI